MPDNKIKLKDAMSYLDEICDEPFSERVELYDLYYEISTKIHEYRKNNNLSQEKFANLLGVTQPMVSKLESGEYNYTIEQLWKIAKKLGWKLNINFGAPEAVDYSVIDYRAHFKGNNIINSYGIEVLGS
jgi:DNA-binding XRE family transcriptional regulator